MAASLLIILGVLCGNVFNHFNHPCGLGGIRNLVVLGYFTLIAIMTHHDFLSVLLLADLLHEEAVDHVRLQEEDLALSASST